MLSVILAWFSRCHKIPDEPTLLEQTPNDVAYTGYLGFTLGGSKDVLSIFISVCLTHFRLIPGIPDQHDPSLSFLNAFLLYFYLYFCDIVVPSFLVNFWYIWKQFESSAGTAEHLICARFYIPNSPKICPFIFVSICAVSWCKNQRSGHSGDPPQSQTLPGNGWQPDSINKGASIWRKRCFSCDHSIH